MSYIILVSERYTEPTVKAIIRRKLHIKAQMLLQFYALSLFSDGIAVIVADAATTHSSAATINRYEVECINV